MRPIRAKAMPHAARRVSAESGGSARRARDPSSDWRSSVTARQRAENSHARVLPVHVITAARCSIRRIPMSDTARAFVARRLDLIAKHYCPNANALRSPHARIRWFIARSPRARSCVRRVARTINAAALAASTLRTTTTASRYAFAGCAAAATVYGIVRSPKVVHTGPRC